MQEYILILYRESELVTEVQSLDTDTSQEPLFCAQDLEGISFLSISLLEDNIILFILFFFFT